MGFIRARVKKHRWHKRILKSNDPLIFSVGWRRYQSIPVYCMEQDTNDRQRFLKYTPEHMHCHCTFYGPLVPQGTGILAFQNTQEYVLDCVRSPIAFANCLFRSLADFRIAMTGTTLEIVQTPSIVKKLKLVRICRTRTSQWW